MTESIVMANRGRRQRDRVGGLLVHTTGSGILTKADKAGEPAQDYAAHHYHKSSGYPHYLIGWDGTVYVYADELTWAAHAAWKTWERKLYRSHEWHRTWAKDFQDDRVQVGVDFYSDWFSRWQGRGYLSPLSILEQIGGRVSPNEIYVGVELLAHPSGAFTDEQYESLADLFRDVCRRHKLLNPKQIVPSTLPQAWLCSHSDVGPIRRWQRTKNDRRRKVPQEGFGWDPGVKLDWDRLGEEIVS